MQEFLGQYLTTYGYGVLFVWTFLEGEAGLILAGFLAFQGYLDIGGVILTALGGAFAGDQFYFYLGRWKGPWLLKAFTLIARKFRKALRLIERYGTFVAFVSRYTYGFRIILPIILGMTTFPARRFLWLNLCSASLWAVLFSLAGYFFGKSASLFVEDVSRYESHLLAILAGLVFCMWLFHLIHARMRRRPARERLKRMRQREFD
ncbi:MULTISPECIES: DedA family protein [Geobacter]|uniref:DedA family protein n=1 Tax=Geobacter TaxID=28231 RepID=UPI0025733D52|nr:DedA family protein [Geobacter sulfurreducens]BEH10541.1 DedA family protein [Geobacter sulfurreducens subsp. ethanolicus]BET57850.1 DedA family protein [Geobacter sp. 60473]HML78504.1 DedA family protein [Geobacter sulfurreducens]